MEYAVKLTEELSQKELLNVMKERVKVFVVEQDCPYQEIDDSDDNALHVILKDKEKIVAYTRIIEENTHISFGRVLVVEEYRKLNLGRDIVKRSIDEIKKKFPGEIIQISGQEHLKSFYESFGFVAVSEVYLEDGIPHMDMVLKF